MDALVVVDLQNDFLPSGALAVARGDEVIEVATQLMPHFSLVVATQDWHPSRHLSFAENHPGKKPGDQIELSGVPQTLWPRHCVNRTPGTRFAPGVKARRFTRVFRKGTNPRIDSYSGFFDNAYLQATGLGDFLRLQGVSRVVIMGLATDYCVRYTALDARKLGFQVTVVVDGCRGVELQPGDIDQSLDAMERAGVSLITSDALIRQKQSNSEEPTILAETRFLRLVNHDDWDFIQRRRAAGVVAIAAVNESRELILIEQFRKPVQARVIELPAGLVDEGDQDDEEHGVAAARRELCEETGYEADRMVRVLDGTSSAGLTDEIVTFFVASGLRKTGPGGGIEDEQISVAEVPLANVREWVQQKQREGYLVDARLFTGVYLLERFLEK